MAPPRTTRISTAPMAEFFLDTGYLIALEAADDQHHTSALAHWRAFSAHLPALVTTTFIFDEVVTFFNSRGHHAKAVDIGQRLLLSPSVELLDVDQQLFSEGWTYFQERPDKHYSLTDCISFIVMQRRQIRTALVFDRHFQQAGFSLLPEPA